MTGAVDLSDGRDPPIPFFQCVVSSPEVEFFLFNRAFPARSEGHLIRLVYMEFRLYGVTLN